MTPNLSSSSAAGADRAQKERATEDIRTELAAARHEAPDAAVAQAEVRARLEAEAAALADRRLAVAEKAQQRTPVPSGAKPKRQNCAWCRASRRVLVGGGARSRPGADNESRGGHTPGPFQSE